MVAYNLPVLITPFIGRSHEIVEVQRLLRTSRLLTLTGVGGTGKTRLALRVASAVKEEFADGVCFVDLCTVSDAALVAKAIAAALGVIGNPQIPLPNTLKRILAEKELLLLLDNFEHVIEAAPLVYDLLATAPRLTALVTSREALRLSGEQEFPVPPLSLPPADGFADLAESEAAILFVQRVQMMMPHFEVTGDNAPAIAQICARLDGLPLAIELAAARCKLLSPWATLARLDSRLTTLTGGSRDAPARQRTLRATLEWSYNLLDEGEKKLFARLAVFRGGSSLKAIEVICTEELPTNIFDGLASLVDKSLIQQKEAPGGEPRFVMLETIHEYARERLASSGEVDIMHGRHAAYFVELAERAQPELRLMNHYYWSELLEIERENLGVVLEWSLGSVDATPAIRLAGALSLFWSAFGHHIEGRLWTDQLLARLDEAPKTYHAKFLVCTGLMAMVRYDLASAKHLFQKALQVSCELGDKRGAAWAQVSLGSAMLEDTDAAIATAEEGLVFFRQLNHKSAIALTLNTIGEIARVGGEDERARLAYEECLVMCRETGDTRRICMILFNLGFLAQHVGDYERARDQLQQGIALAQTINNKFALALGLTFLAGPLGSTGQLQRAVRLLGASEAALERIGAFITLADKVEVDRNMAAVRAQLDVTAFETAWAEGREMTLDQAVNYALHNIGLEVGHPGQVGRSPLANPLTTRELEILHLMAQGMSNRAIAERLFLAVGSVKWYGSQICNKLQAQNRVQAIVRARELNILP